MKQTMLLATIVLAMGLSLTGCTSSNVIPENAYIYKGKNFGSNRTAAFKRGVVDGCTTAAGDYKKDHRAFKEDEHYRVGWGDGRLQCYDINKEKDT